MLKLFGAMCAIAVFSLVGSPAGAETKVSIGFGLNGDTLTAQVAKEEGIFKKNGLDATLTLISGNSAMLASLFSGSVNFIATSPIPMLTGVNGGLDLIVVSGGARTTKANDPIGLIARKGVDYSRPSDLIGKTVVVGGFDSGTYFIFRQWLSMKGVDSTKVNFLESATPTHGDLLKSGRADFVTSVEPLRSKIEADGLGRVVEKFNTEVIPDQPSIFWTSTSDWANKNREAVKAFRASLREADAFITANPARAREIEKAIYKTNGPSLPNSNEVVTPADLEAFYRIGQDLGVYDKHLDFSKLIFKE